MNRRDSENRFRGGLETLLETIKREQTRPITNPYADASDQALHEHDTRIFFFDQLLKLLGWELGADGNVIEEVRIKSETTRFIDYVGVKPGLRTPLLIFEAKAWNKPLISGKGRRVTADKNELVICAVQHIHNGGKKEDSPVTGEWHEYLTQLGRYVRTAKEDYGYSVPRAVLSSGQWLLIFTSPTEAFCDGKLGYNQFLLLEHESYVPEADKIFDLLACENLVSSPPDKIRSTELTNYVSIYTYKASYHAILIRYETSGSQLFTQSPRILLYPALLVENKRGTMFTVIDSELPIDLPLLRFGDDEKDFTAHFRELAEKVENLLECCSRELRIKISSSSLVQFPGFNESSHAEDNNTLGTTQRILIRTIRKAPDNWLAVVGESMHFLLETPKILCRFHEWAACRDADCAIGTSAINTPSTARVRSFFIDSALHHCANQTVIDRRQGRCQIGPIDSRTCCKACVYHDLCWLEEEASALPCGN